MNGQTDTPKPRKAKSLDDEINAAQERLNRLLAQKREKERKELERNQKAISAFLRAEKLDTVPVEKWSESLPALRRLFKVDSGKTPVLLANETGDPQTNGKKTAQPAPQSESA